ncbi:MAG TPA: hypothetical protein VFA09_10165 [Ktedonobacteraceae bacterium]|nr:hypothetical protein [Ktedonobacteraceae bacterium]
MRALQLQASGLNGCRSLTTPCPDSQWEQPDQWAGRGQPAGPNLPGRASRLRPYPSSRRRRRR